MIIMRYNYKEIIVIITLSILGCMTDAIMYALDIYSFSYTKQFFILDNIWLISLWVIFLTTFNSSLNFLKNVKTYFLSIIGFFGGVFSYFLAFKLKVITFSNIYLSLFYISIIWLCIFPALYKGYQRIITISDHE